MASARPAAVPRPSSRPRETQDPLNLYLYHPLAARLARLLLPTGIPANAVSVFSLVALIGAAFAYTELSWPAGVLTGFGLMLLWHVIDGADGDLARMKGTASTTGELVDGVCDYLGNVIMYFAFAFLLDDTLGGWAWVLAWSAGGSHIVQTNHAESQRRAYLWRAHGVPWLRNDAADGEPLFRKSSWFTRYFGFWAVGYLWLAQRMSPGANAIDAALADTAGDPARTLRIRRLVRRASRGSLHLEKALGGNPKTIIIGLSMAAGSPAWYFLTVIFVLNLILIWSVVHHNRMNRRLAAILSPSP
ncbi:MAG TPA: CDP-alcohol phosphatidyltransferase family protein [Allosphingosinicella sp.]|nr:CDP-alcohol phosphatidyltransferase family protein [Allosphingosinicella sp.]